MQQSMLRIAGESFTCNCGCNVFHPSAPFEGKETFQCNGCNLEYATEVDVVIDEKYNYVMLSWNPAQNELAVENIWIGKEPEPDDIFFIDSDIDLQNLDDLYAGLQITTVGHTVYKLEKRGA